MTSTPVFAIASISLSKVLWVGPTADLPLNKDILETLAAQGVATASSHREVFDLRATSAFSLAILSDTLGLLMLSAVARCVRSQWPSTRIVLIKRKQPTLEDHLYDDEVEYRLPIKELTAKLLRLTLESSKRIALRRV